MEDFPFPGGEEVGVGLEAAAGLLPQAELPGVPHALRGEGLRRTYRIAGRGDREAAKEGARGVRGARAAVVKTRGPRRAVDKQGRWVGGAWAATRRGAKGAKHGGAVHA